MIDDSDAGTELPNNAYYSVPDHSNSYAPIFVTDYINPVKKADNASAE